MTTTRFNPFSLANLAYQVALELGEVQHGRTSLAGGVLTETDTIGRTEPADYWNGGTFFVLATQGADPTVTRFSVIADFASGVFTLTLADAFDPTDQYDLYGVAGPYWQIFDYLAAINAAISDIGKIVYTRTGDITTAAAQLEYPLVAQADDADQPTLIAPDAELRMVRIQTDTADSNANYWTTDGLPPWRVRPGGIGSMPTLIFEWQPPTAYALELTFVGQHPRLAPEGSITPPNVYLDTWVELDAGVPYRLVVLRAALSLLQQKKGRRFIHPRLKDLTDTIQQKLADLEQRQAPHKPAEPPKLFLIPNYGERTSYRYLGERP